MAGIPLNTFKTVTGAVNYLNPLLPTPTGILGPTSPYYVYGAPPGLTGIILYMQVSNIDPTNTYTTSAWHYRPSTLTWTNLVKNISAPVADARIMLGGKLVLQTFDELYVSGNDASQLNLQLIISLLESANQ